MPDKPKKYKIVISKDALWDIKSTKKYILDTFKYREYAENQQINLLQSSRFGEALRITQEHLDSRNFYIMNPEFDTGIAGNNGGCGCDK